MGCYIATQVPNCIYDNFSEFLGDCVKWKQPTLKFTYYMYYMILLNNIVEIFLKKV